MESKDLRNTKEKFTPYLFFHFFIDKRNSFSYDKNIKTKGG